MDFTADHAAQVAAILADAARTEVIPRFKALADGDVRHKTSIFDPVSEADEAAERVISAALAERFPAR